MKSTIRLGGALVGAVLFAGAATAADPLPMAPPSPPPPPMAMEDHAFDWTGLTFGAHAGYAPGPNAIFAGGQVGYAFAAGPIVLGVEARLAAVWDATPAVGTASLLARVGLALGPDDRILAYGLIGYGGIFGSGLTALGITFGGGLAIGIGERLSVFGEARTIAGAWTFTLGLNLHR